ncbi:hypothetical protein [Clostridium lundense]|uniref:hypothetical protein n=1 Tax=Clostridium lundense TaxID=319475 RepID=UPI00048466CE|nr:hypothetical protein [Clostridium lundense]
MATFGVGATLAVAAIGAIAVSAAAGASKAGTDNINSQLSKNGGDISKTDYGEVLKAEFWSAVTGATNMFKTELYAGIDWTFRCILDLVSVANESGIFQIVPFNFLKLNYFHIHIKDGKRNASNSSHQFFRDKAPYKKGFDAAEFVLNVATLASGVKSISNIGKNLPGKIPIRYLSLSRTGIKIPVLCLDAATSIASASEISSIAASGLVLCKMASNSGSE